LIIASTEFADLQKFYYIDSQLDTNIEYLNFNSDVAGQIISTA